MQKQLAHERVQKVGGTVEKEISYDCNGGDSAKKNYIMSNQHEIKNEEDDTINN